MIDKESLPRFLQIIQGRPLTPEAKIIIALVNRLGGEVSLDWSELEQARGLVVFAPTEGVGPDSKGYLHLKAV